MPPTNRDKAALALFVLLMLVSMCFMPGSEGVPR